ncbi:calcium-binding protein, partial [Cardiobacterium hominis]|uniref:calcium-binding protein n=1 Tax=Cardiobacterium hominis TaxID=2718 RepID=UPI001177FB49
AVIDYKKYEGVTDPESLKIFEREKRGDWVHGQYGNDTIYGSAKEDILIGGEGFDTIRGGAGKDLILGDADYIPFATSPAIMGNITGYHWLADGTPPRSKKEGVMSIPNGNVFSWQWKTEVKEKDSGNESWDFTISPGPSHTALLRNDRFQQLENGNWNDTIYGGEGDDIIFGQLGDDTIHGGDGDDVLHGDDFNPLPDNMPGGKDTLYGGAGNDRLFAGGGNATMNGGSGNDIYHSGKGNDTMTDESGDDVYWLSSGLDGVNDQGSGYDTYHIAFDGSMISGFTTISDADGKGSITYRGKALTADQVQVTGENEWRTNDGTAKLTRMGSSLVITNTLEDFKGRIIFNGFFNTGESLGLKLPSLDDDNKPNPDPKTQPDPKPQPEQPQAPTAGKPLAAQS